MKWLPLTIWGTRPPKQPHVCAICSLYPAAVGFLQSDLGTEQGTPQKFMMAPMSCWDGDLIVPVGMMVTPMSHWDGGPKCPVGIETPMSCWIGDPKYPIGMETPMSHWIGDPKRPVGMEAIEQGLDVSAAISILQN